GEASPKSVRRGKVVRAAERLYGAAESGGDRFAAAAIRVALREPVMIKPRRVGHATFETPDLEKAIAYYGEFMGLVLAEREKDRAFLATKIGQLVIELNKLYRPH